MYSRSKHGVRGRLIRVGGESGGWERRERRTGLSVLSICARTGSAMWLHCRIPETDPPLPPSLISPPSFGSCHLSSPFAPAVPPTVSLPFFSPCPHFCPFSAVAVHSLNHYFLSPLLIPNILLSSPRDNVLF